MLVVSMGLMNAPDFSQKIETREYHQCMLKEVGPTAGVTSLSPATVVGVSETQEQAR